MTVLLVGATGNVGPHVVRALVERDVESRILTHDAARAATVLPAGVELREGDPGDDETILAAAQGVESIFLLTPHDHGMTDVQLRIIRALRRTDARIVKLSGTSSAINPDGPYTCRQHWEVEQILAVSGRPWSVVRPNAYMQTLIGNIMAPAIRATGKIPNAVGTAGISFVDARDVGAVCAAMLVDSKQDGETLVLTGPRSVTYAEIAAVISADSGQPVETLEITPADVRRSLLGRGMAEWEAGHFEEMYQVFRDGESEFVTDDVERVLGRPPRTVEAYLHEEREHLAPPAG